MYKHIIRPLLFSLNPETAHNLTFTALRCLRYVPFAKPLARMAFRKDDPALEREVFGLKFRNPVGLAGGLDKNGEFYNDLANFGFGFVEIGSLTPEPQPGNPKPRLFRVVKDRATHTPGRAASYILLMIGNFISLGTGFISAGVSMVLYIIGVAMLSVSSRQTF